MYFAKRVTAVLLFLLMIGIVAVVFLYRSTPLGNTAQTRFDTIIVLGCPASPDGGPSPVQRERVSEGVRQYRAGVAPTLIMTGGAAHNRYVEAEVMAKIAEAQGVPPAAILEESWAQNTIQNAYYSFQMMKAHGWHSAEVVSSQSHLPRASLIFARFPIRYRMQGARQSAESEFYYPWTVYAYEACRTDFIRLFGFGHSRYLP
ncbi:MAG: YdcF family protein [Bryobacteraceae bacterium]